MAIVGLVELILWELKVDHVVFLNPYGPDTIDGGVVRLAVVNAVHTDVGGPDEVLELERLV